MLGHRHGHLPACRDDRPLVDRTDRRASLRTSKTRRSFVSGRRCSDHRPWSSSVTQSGETIDTLGAMNHVRRTLGRAAGGDHQRRRLRGNPPGRRLNHHPLRTRGWSRVYQDVCRVRWRRLYSAGLPDRTCAGATEPEQDLTNRLEQLLTAPSLLERGIRQAERCAEIAQRCSATASNFLVLGRGIEYPLAMEAALKCKEISYVHAEGYAAGEMKHGPIALLDRGVPRDRAGAARSVVRQDDFGDSAGQGAAGAGDRCWRRGRSSSWPRLVDHFIGVPPAPPLLTPFSLTPVDPVARLSARAHARPGHRSTAQPGQDGHGRVGVPVGPVDVSAEPVVILGRYSCARQRGDILRPRAVNVPGRPARTSFMTSDSQHIVWFAEVGRDAVPLGGRQRARIWASSRGPRFPVPLRASSSPLARIASSSIHSGLDHILRRTSPWPERRRR